MTKEYVGSIAVDSGLLHFSDPLYINDFSYDKNWDTVSELAGEHNYFYLCPSFAGLVFSDLKTKWKSCLPVFIERDAEGSVKKIIIELMEEKNCEL